MSKSHEPFGYLATIAVHIEPFFPLFVEQL